MAGKRGRSSSQTRKPRRKLKVMPDHNMAAYLGRCVVTLFVITSLALSMSSGKGCDFITITTEGRQPPSQWDKEPFQNALDIRIGVFEYELLESAAGEVTEGCVEYEMDRKEMKNYYPRVSRAQRCAYAGPVFGIIALCTILLDTLVFFCDYGAFITSLCLIICCGLQGGVFGLMSDLCVNDGNTECTHESGVIEAAFACVMYMAALILFCTIPKANSGAPPLAMCERKGNKSDPENQPKQRRNAGAMWSRMKKDKRRIKHKVRKRRGKSKQKNKSKDIEQGGGDSGKSSSRDAGKSSEFKKDGNKNSSSKPESHRSNSVSVDKRSRSTSRPPRGRSTSRTRQSGSSSVSNKKGRSQSRDTTKRGRSKEPRPKKSSASNRGRSASSRSVDRKPPGRSKSGMSVERKAPGRSKSGMSVERKAPDRSKSGMSSSTSKRNDKASRAPPGRSKSGMSTSSMSRKSGGGKSSRAPPARTTSHSSARTAPSRKQKPSSKR
mmetsp:Transcript_25373/g.71047  ORF Transcript_25373/g.71047 Transcript_25373/m.71047 type:complete len:494 (-) Transcript_25373:266-1747(-)|eukprot:CAMPEP_0119547172 /NCGR_PEP_ID=MMETSP1352-20130426/1367_1 /TAXON_ID=265584 /ORGANISM="Stauroneis constricta, Strain CCMP1120" /LENGTH=493 /DNA_ID=CAMNT_0007592029 /DNA_START=246 /DNA_END=1727 /DNA_ORIENTATION=+